MLELRKEMITLTTTGGNPNAKNSNIQQETKTLIAYVHPLCFKHAKINQQNISISGKHNQLGQIRVTVQTKDGIKIY